MGTRSSVALQRFSSLEQRMCFLQVLRGIDTKTLTRQELKNHLQARDLSTTGNKAQLAERLQASVLEEQVRRTTVDHGLRQLLPRGLLAR